MNAIVLTPDQAAANKAFVGFIMDPEAEVFVLSGYAGTGKTTLVNKMLSELPKTLEAANVISPRKHDWDIHLTATTNKACEALSDIVNREVRTIQSFLGLRVKQDYKNKTTELVPAKDTVHENCIIVVDEISFCDDMLKYWIEKLTDNCKIVFIGDPAQLLPIKSSTAPIFNAGYKTAQLTKVMRQAEGNPILDMATAFRHTVNTGEWPKIKLDGHHIQHLSRDDFKQAMLKEFNRPDWRYSESKVLAWTNKAVIKYNHDIREAVQGEPTLQVGDYAVCNKYINRGKSCNIKTDQTVLITAINRATDHDVEGWNVVMDNKHSAFLPVTQDSKKTLVTQARAKEDFELEAVLDRHWIDLRAAYACTVNKSQGSTYDKVFIDLDDISKCRNGNTMARMLYVAVSRARDHVYLTGDIHNEL